MKCAIRFVLGVFIIIMLISIVVNLATIVLYGANHETPLHNPYWPFSVEIQVRDR